MNAESTRTLQYRPDIDGLRAIAVLLVLGYHAGVPFLGGGFIGVDVFFVISGYLITSLLLKEYEADGRISLWEFWSRRVRRLAPALLLTVGVVLVAAPFLLQRVGNETGPLARAALATLLVNANHFFWFESSDYFAPAAEFNPLLHMWSLAVEEQFYLLWPLLMLLVMRRCPGARGWWVIAGLALLSFALALFLTIEATAGAFFFMPARAWELAAGALLAWSGLRSSRSWTPLMGSMAGVVGIALVIGSGVLLRGDLWFPAPAVLLPVLGSVMLLAAGASAPTNFIARLLSTRAMVYIGKVSYPLYLWHWPVLVFLRSQRLYEKDLALDVASLAISFVLAVLTFEFVERKAASRLRHVGPRRILVAGMAGTAVLLMGAVLLGAWTRLGWGYSEREKFLAAARVDFPTTGCIFAGSLPGDEVLNRCFPPTTKPSVLLWGDSHAEHWGPALKAVSAEADINLGILTIGSCRPASGVPTTEACQRAIRQVMEQLPHWMENRHLKGVVISARWPIGVGSVSPAYSERWGQEEANERAGEPADPILKFEAELDAKLAALTGSGLKVLIVLPSPILRVAGVYCLAVRSDDRCHISATEMDAYVKPSEDVIRKVVARYPNARTMDPKDFLCGQGRCPAILNGTIIYRDESHISNTLSKASKDHFAAPMKWLTE